MKKFLSIVTITMVMTTVISSFTVVVPSKVNAAAATISSTQQQVQQSTTSSVKAYNYVAQPKDSYTLMARKAIQTYGLTNKVKLSQAKIIYAETLLTQEAGSPYLNLGQKVSIKQDSVKNLVDKAQKLSKDQEAAWQTYAVGVNFNTNAVGQAK